MNEINKYKSTKMNWDNIFQNFKIKQILAISLLISTTISLAQNQEPEMDFLNEDQVVNEFLTIERQKLVEFNLSNGNTIKFSTVGTEFQISESGSTGENEISVLEQIEGNPLDKFLQLTDENTPVPKALLEFSSLEEPYSENNKELNYKGIDEELIDAETINMERDSFNQFKIRESLLKNRAIVDELQDSIYIELESPRFKTLDLSIKAAGQGSCNNSTGYLYFEDNHCGHNGSMGKGSTASSCDRGMHNYVDRRSTTGKRVTFTRTAYCGSDSAYINHFTYYSQWNQGWVKLGPSIYLDPYTWKYLETRAGKYDLPRKRRAYVNRFSNSGYVRAWNKFYRQVK